MPFEPEAPLPAGEKPAPKTVTLGELLAPLPTAVQEQVLKLIESAAAQRADSGQLAKHFKELFAPYEKQLAESANPVIPDYLAYACVYTSMQVRERSVAHVKSVFQG